MFYQGVRGHWTLNNTINEIYTTMSYPWLKGFGYL